MRYIKRPRIDRRTKQQVGWYYQFRTYNPKTRRTEPVPVAFLPEYIRKCESDEVAQAYCDNKSSEESMVRYHAKLRVQWRKKHYDFDVLLDRFSKYQKTRAPNSWGNDIHYLKKYVFHFFLGMKDANNLGNWSLYFESFRQWLQEVRPLKYQRKRLAFSTINKCITATNVFLNWASVSGLVERVPKCPVFPRHLLNSIGADDLVERHEIEEIYNALKMIRAVSADLYKTIAYTGLRINEAIGLSLAFLFEGQIGGIKARKIHKALGRHRLRYHGFICLESQPALKSIRDKQGRVPRKPLKGRKTIHPRNFRYVPIFDREVWNILVHRWNRQLESFHKKKAERDKGDYLLFEEITAAVFYSDLLKAHRMVHHVRFRGPHKLRHTFLTWFYDKTNEDMFLAEKVAGHRDRKTMENYSHLAEQIGNEIRLQASFNRKMNEAA